MPFHNKWIKISLFNLLIVSLFGVTMRYKIAFALPFIEQKKFLNAHSHFAFAGWVTQILMFLLIWQLKHTSFQNVLKKYKPILYANLITAYGMLISFPFEGYGFFSIFFSTLSIFVSYWFAVVFWKDINRQPQKKLGHNWFKAALVFNVFSSAGPFTLAYLMAKKMLAQKLMLLSVYFFLHFQYNGWFFFACMGLFTLMMEDIIGNKKLLQLVFYCFLIAIIPAYFLSALWLPVPFIVYLIIVLAALLQLVALFYLFKIIIQNKIIFFKINATGKTLFALCFAALCIKLILQAGSIIPSLSKVAFSFRPIIIGYIHLVLLGVITIFLLAYISTHQLNSFSKKFKTGIYIFVSGIILNEVILMCQGINDIGEIWYIPLSFFNQSLFVVAVIMFTGLAFINVSFYRNNSLNENDCNHKLSV